MSAVLNETFELHRHILRDLTLRETAIASKEAEARKALEQIIRTCEAEKGAIQQHRELLAQAESLYRRFADTDPGDSPVPVPEPSEAPAAVAAAAPEQTSAPAQLATDETPSGPTLAALAPAEVEIASTLDALRNQIINEHRTSLEPAEAGANRRWLGMWKS